MQPVAVVGVLSVATIFAAAMNNIMTSIGERQATIADNMLGV